MDTLATYELDLVKTGVILQGLRKMRKMSRAYAAESIGVTTDIVKNIENGMGGLSFERMIKFCALYEMPIIAIVLLIIKDADIDFRESILVYDHQNDVPTPVTDDSVPAVPGMIPDAVVAAADAVEPAPEPVMHDVPVCDHHGMLDTVLRAHDAHIADLQHEIARQDQTIRQLIELLGR